MKATGIIMGLILGTPLTTALAHDLSANPGYWSTPDGTVLRTGFGECWRTIEWTPALAIPECEGGKSTPPTSAAVAPAPADPPKMAPTPAATEPVAARAAPEPAPQPVPAAAPDPASAAPAVAGVAVAAVTVEPEPAPEPVPAEVFESISLSGGALFDSGKSSLKGDDIDELDRLAETMRRYPQIESVEVLGHTDSRGPSALNWRLSEQRAESVRDYLVKRGVDAGRITTRGLGPSAPIASNETAAGRARNRRVEINVQVRDRVR